MIQRGNSWEIRRGDWREILDPSFEYDAVITDPPYSFRTHGGHDCGVESTRKSCAKYDEAKRSQLIYSFWGTADVELFAEFFCERTRWWIVVMTDHILFPVYQKELRERGWYTFAPIPFVSIGSRVRLLGDGPSNWTIWILVARRRTKDAARWGTLPGAYILPKGKGDRNKSHWMAGAKPEWIMDQLVEHYSRPGHVIVDPCAGTGTTLVAASRLSRKSIGCETDEATFRVACERLMHL